jgi:hypothetical protein
MIPIIKKNGYIRLCEDYRNLNVSSLKDNYPLPNMEAMLQRVIGCEIFSMMDSFLGYNKKKVKSINNIRLHLPLHGEHMCM